MFNQQTDLTLSQEFQRRTFRLNEPLYSIFDIKRSNAYYYIKFEGICECCGVTFSVFNRPKKDDYPLCEKCDDNLSNYASVKLKTLEEEFGFYKSVMNRLEPEFVFSKPEPIEELSLS